MTEVELRLSDLREAAEKLRLASRRIGQSIVTVQNTIDPLLLAGLEDPSITIQYAQHRGVMAEWAEKLFLFSEKLFEASEDLEQALIDFDAKLAHLGQPIGYAAAMSNRGLTLNDLRRDINELLSNEKPSIPVAPPTPPPPLEMDAFISKANRPLYDAYIQQQKVTNELQTKLDQLTLTRQQSLENLVALKNRLLSMDNMTNINSIPRIQAMQDELNQLDLEIIQTKDQLAVAQAELDSMADRLNRVVPAPGANLRIIQQLENSETSQWIRDHTYGCVNHVVNKVAIPPGIPKHAYLWDQAVLDSPQYGISFGDVPLEGSIIVFEREHSFADDLFGHLMYVEKVEDGVVWITDNYHPDVPVRLDDITLEVTGDNVHYLYLPWHTKA